MSTSLLAEGRAVWGEQAFPRAVRLKGVTGQLAAVAVGGTPQGAYIYDYLARLVVRQLPASTTTLHLVHDRDGNVIAEYDGTGALKREYVWLEDRPIAAITAGSPTYERCARRVLVAASSTVPSCVITTP